MMRWIGIWIMVDGTRTRAGNGAGTVVCGSSVHSGGVGAVWLQCGSPGGSREALSRVQVTVILRVYWADVWSLVNVVVGYN